MAPIGSLCESGQATLLWRRTCTKALRRRMFASLLAGVVLYEDVYMLKSCEKAVTSSPRCKILRDYG